MIARAFLPGLLLLAGVPTLAFGQIPVDYPIVAVSLPQDCDTAPAVCDMPDWFEVLGTYDFWICPIFAGGYADTVRFGVAWPEEWVLQQSDLCYGTVVEGGIQGPGDGLTLALPAAPMGARAAIRLRINATTAGRLSLIADPGTGQFAYRQDNGPWWPFYAGVTGQPPEAFFVQVGPLATCERAPAPLRCSFCDYLHGGGTPGWVSMPSRLELLAGAIAVDTLQAWSYECRDIPECSMPYPGVPCLDWVSSDAEWLSFRLLDEGIGALRLEMTVDARALIPGNYSTIARAYNWCGNCGSLCYAVDLIVLPLSVERVSWGAVKATYR